MDETHSGHEATSFLVGTDLLDKGREIEASFDALTRLLLRSEQLGVRTPKVYEHLGTALSLLSQLASCAWGCRGGEHTVENLVRRFCNFAFAALRLAFSGFYDEALGLVRGMTEIVNLLQLFSVQPSTLERWKELTPEQRKRVYTSA